MNGRANEWETLLASPANVGGGAVHAADGFDEGVRTAADGKQSLSPRRRAAVDLILPLWRSTGLWHVSPQLIRLAGISKRFCRRDFRPLLICMQEPWRQSVVLPHLHTRMAGGASSSTWGPECSGGRDWKWMLGCFCNSQWSDQRSDRRSATFEGTYNLAHLMDGFLNGLESISHNHLALGPGKVLVKKGDQLRRNQSLTKKVNQSDLLLSHKPPAVARRHAPCV